MIACGYNFVIIFWIMSCIVLVVVFVLAMLVVFVVFVVRVVRVVVIGIWVWLLFSFFF